MLETLKDLLIDVLENLDCAEVRDEAKGVLEDDGDPWDEDRFDALWTAAINHIQDALHKFEGVS